MAKFSRDHRGHIDTMVWYNLLNAILKRGCRLQVRIYFITLKRDRQPWLPTSNVYERNGVKFQRRADVHNDEDQGRTSVATDGLLEHAMERLKTQVVTIFEYSKSFVTS